MKALIFVLFSILCSGQGILKPILAGAPSPASGEPTFTHIQGGIGANASSGTTVTLTAHAGWSAPTAGNAVLCRVSLFDNSLSISSIADANGNAFTVTPNSPSNVQPGAVQIFLAYRFYGGGDTPSATITATASNTITFDSAIACDEFHRSSGIWVLDIDAASSGGGSTTINTPFITPAVTGELLYAGAESQGTIDMINSPWVAGGGWPGSPGGDRHGWAYILASSSGGTALDFHQSTSSQWNSMALAVK